MAEGGISVKGDIRVLDEERRGKKVLCGSMLELASELDI